jgi:hypothetical protein
MGIEPTQDASQRPANGFEDRGRHQSSFIPSLANLYFGCLASNRGATPDASRPRFSKPLPTFLKTAGVSSITVLLLPPSLDRPARESATVRSRPRSSPGLAVFLAVGLRGTQSILPGATTHSHFCPVTAAIRSKSAS